MEHSSFHQVGVAVLLSIPLLSPSLLPKAPRFPALTWDAGPLRCVKYKACALKANTQSYKPEKALPIYLPRIPYPQNKLMSTIDSCRRSNRNWASKRQDLVNCVVGFGKGTMGGRNGKIYAVTDPSDDPLDPKPGTLRYGETQSDPLWIIFKRYMVIKPKNELMVNSFKTIDGRGTRVEIAHGPCITIEGVRHVIVHRIWIHDCTPRKPGLVRSSPEHVGHREGADGDGITVFPSSNVWIDHCFLGRWPDGLLDVVHASTATAISSNYFTQDDKVMLLGHQDCYTADRNMKVTVVFNHFGPGLAQGMPRVRYGYAHVANIRYDRWIMYAIGGSADPTILSEGNYYGASDNPYAKQVTKRESDEDWKNWKWRPSKDVFENGAYFVPSGWGSCASHSSRSKFFTAAPGPLVPLLTSDAGPLSCVASKAC
ncbi:Pectate lyase [Bertholletia excelsa]